MKKIAIYIPDSTSAIYLPLFWASAKSYYELKGQRTNEWEWIHPRINYEFDTKKLKKQLLDEKPDVFGISMYLWNDVQCLEIARWVKETFPNCIVISGGPQQYFKHESDWFEKYPFLDASLDGGEYGELTITDILDNLRTDNSIDWNQVREVVYPSKNKKTILKSKKTSSKREFFWDYSPYMMQKKIMLECSDEIRSLHKNSKIEVGLSVNGKLETTRGCPYSCAFCDWGGGIASKVIKKSIEKVKEDILVLEESGCAYIFLCDANFGILGKRDIDIIKFIAERKINNPSLFHVYFGGFAKSDKHTEVIKKILDIDARFNLTWDLSYKASVQSIHIDVLDNIKRSDISFDKHTYLAKFLKNNYGFSSYAECISGLPGMTPDKWYEEINVYASHDMDICLYHWHLLPETPSYDKKYRQKMGIGTVNKFNNLYTSNSTLRKSEVVVETFSYSKEDYKEMWLAFSIQRAFWSTGLLSKTIKKILTKSNIGYGDFVKLFYRQFLRNSPGKVLQQHMDEIDKRFLKYFDSNSEVSNLSLNFPTTPASLYSSFMLMLFYKFDEVKNDISVWLLKQFPHLKKNDVTKELDEFIHIKNIFTSKLVGMRYIRYTNEVIYRFEDESESVLIDFFMNQMETYTRTNFLTAKVIGV